MGEPTAPDGEIVRVPTERVDAVIRLQDIVDRVRDRAVARAARVDDGSGAPTERDALRRVSELAAQLSDELARMGPLDE